MGAPGLRERKKAQTRRRISDVATRLFITRGFEQVSVAEVAEAAEVSKMTVFNYFPRKEDLILDRHTELIDLLTDSIRGRAEGESPLAALRQLLVGIAREGNPISGLRDDVAPFFRTVL
jgi:AcrR family transcriptional regulator